MIIFIIGIILSIVTVVGDVLVKQASLQSSFSGWKFLLLGAVIYALTAFGWFFVMRSMKLSTLGVLYAVTCVVLLAFVSMFFFKEKVSTIEILGISLGILSIILLYKFA